jgi:hypothetical protein
MSIWDTVSATDFIIYTGVFIVVRTPFAGFLLEKPAAPVVRGFSLFGTTQTWLSTSGSPTNSIDPLPPTDTGSDDMQAAFADSSAE